MGFELAGRNTIVICQKGLKSAKALRLAPLSGRAGGFSMVALAWAQAGLPMIPEAKLPPRNRQGQTIWITRCRPKIDRVACPWLIRRFVDPDAIFLFVAPSQVQGVADRFGGAPFDIEGEGVLEPSG